VSIIERFNSEMNFRHSDLQTSHNSYQIFTLDEGRLTVILCYTYSGLFTTKLPLTVLKRPRENLQEHSIMTSIRRAIEHIEFSLRSLYPPGQLISLPGFKCVSVVEIVFFCLTINGFCFVSGPSLLLLCPYRLVD
jgi:hypothetical protein